MPPAADPSLPNLTVAQLEYLVAVHRAPTWADAAASLGVSPSALSQGLAELERRVGVPLFERVGRRRRLAPSARPVLDHAEAVVARTRDLARWAERARLGRVGTLRIGMIDAAAVHHFPETLRRFRADRPELDVRLAVAPSGELLARLLRAELDVVVCVAPPRPLEGIEADLLGEEPLAVHAPPGTDLGPPAGWGPWVTFPMGSHTRLVIGTALAARGAPVDVVAESHQPEVLREMVRLGLGWTVLPGADAPRLTVRRLVVCRRAAAVPDTAALALVDDLRAAAPRVLSPPAPPGG